MKHAGIEVPVKNAPPLDPGFPPVLKFNQAFLATAKKPVDIAVERASGQMAVCHTFIHGTPEMAEADRYYVNRLVMTSPRRSRYSDWLLWRYCVLSGCCSISIL